MLVDFHFEIVLNKKFLFLKPIEKFGFVFIDQHFKTFYSLIDNFFSFWVHYLQKIFLEHRFSLSLLDQYHISDDKGILFGLHPDILA